MINDNVLSQVKEILRCGNLEKMRACYMRYSKDWDAQKECKEYEQKILSVGGKQRNIAWTKEVYDLRDTRLSDIAKKYFKLSGKLQVLVKEADEVAARYRSECQVKAKAIDERLDSFIGSLTNERIREAKEFIREYYSTSADITRFCQKATGEAIKRFDTRLSQNQRDNDLRAEAASLDKRFAGLPPLTRDRKCFAVVDDMIARIRSSSYDVLRYCSTASVQAANKLESAVKAEKKYLDYEEKITELSTSRSHTTIWCEKVWSAFSLILMDIDKCRNGQLLRELKKQADQVDIEIVCEPYKNALSPDSDFKRVFELDKALKSFKDKPKLEKGIPSFDTKWKQRVEKANEQSQRKAAEYYDQAEALYRDDKYELAYKLFLEADRYGNLYAASALGRHHYYGRGVTKDLNKAVSYFKKAADNGIRVAMSYLADIYRDKGQASEHFLWRKRAVDAGFEADKLVLAKLYFEGIGTKQSYAEARKLFEQMVNDDVYGPEANAYLGKMHQNGFGVSVNEELAVGYYEKAKSISWAKEAYDKLFAKLDGERRDREITENFEKAQAGDPWAQYFIGWCYYTGYRCDRHYREALKWFEKAAAGGVGKAMNILGDMYSKGEGVSVDKSKAIKYYKDAVDHGEN